MTMLDDINGPPCHMPGATWPSGTTYRLGAGAAGHTQAPHTKTSTRLSRETPRGETTHATAHRVEHGFRSLPCTVRTWSCGGVSRGSRVPRATRARVGAGCAGRRVLGAVRRQVRRAVKPVVDVTAGTTHHQTPRPRYLTPHSAPNATTTTPLTHPPTPTASPRHAPVHRDVRRGIRPGASAATLPARLVHLGARRHAMRPRGRLGDHSGRLRRPRRRHDTSRRRRSRPAQRRMGRKAGNQTCMRITTAHSGGG